MVTEKIAKTIQNISNLKMSTKRKHESVMSNSSKHSKTSKTSHWALGLLDSMNDPELQVMLDDSIVVIKDKFPKAKFHYLILPKENISNLKSLTSDHLKLLKHMEDVGNELVNDEKHKKFHFKFGYHAAASMHRLHMHVISDDMNSPCLKTKKHWNTFTTQFFLNPTAIREDLEKHGKVSLPSSTKLKEYLDTPLECNKCEFKPKNLPTLKQHILTHLKKD